MGVVGVRIHHPSSATKCGEWGSGGWGGQIHHPSSAVTCGERERGVGGGGVESIISYMWRSECVCVWGGGGRQGQTPATIISCNTGGVRLNTTIISVRLSTPMVSCGLNLSICSRRTSGKFQHKCFVPYTCLCSPIPIVRFGHQIQYGEMGEERGEGRKCLAKHHYNRCMSVHFYGYMYCWNMSICSWRLCHGEIRFSHLI